MSNDETLEDIRAQKLEEYQSGGQSTDQDEVTAGSPTEPIDVHGSDDLAEAVNTYDVVLADFYADWCGPCKMIAPTVAEIAAETEAAVVKIDVDANQQLAAEYGVRGVPTLVLFAGGQQVEEVVGVKGKDALVSLVEQYS